MSVIVKCGNEDGGVKEDLAKKLNLFEKETEMFGRTFPNMYQILGDFHTLSSKCLYTSLSPHSIIVLEDLTTLGFNVLPRHIGFDLEHCFVVIEKLAKMHAVSVIMYENVRLLPSLIFLCRYCFRCIMLQDPSQVRLYSEGLYANNPLTKEWVAAGYKGLIDACSRWPGEF